MQSTNGQASRKVILYARVSTEEQARSLRQSGDTRTLLRNATAAGSSSSSGGEPVVEFVNGANGLNFTYLKSNGDPATQESEIEIVRITLDIRVEGGANEGTQTLTTDVDLRNRGS